MQLSAQGHGIPRIQRKVEEDLLELIAIGAHEPQMRSQVRGQDAHLAKGARNRGLHFDDRIVDVQRLQAHRLVAAERQQLAGEGGGHGAGLFDLESAIPGAVGKTFTKLIGAS